MEAVIAFWSVLLIVILILLQDYSCFFPRRSRFSFRAQCSGSET